MPTHFLHRPRRAIVGGNVLKISTSPRMKWNSLASTINSAIHMNDQDRYVNATMGISLISTVKASHGEKTVLVETMGKISGLRKC